MAVNLNDIMVEGSTYRISLSKLTGQRIVDISGYVSGEFGDDTPVFKISQIHLENGTEIWVEGEHDIAYIPAGNGYQNNLDDDTLADLYHQQQVRDGEVDENE